MAALAILLAGLGIAISLPAARRGIGSESVLAVTGVSASLISMFVLGQLR